jgi:methionyl-tRNA formyltransferase
MKISFVYFGTSLFSTIVLDELFKQGFVPSLIVSTPDKPQGRNHLLIDSPAKAWADAHNIPIIQPEKLKDESVILDIKNRAGNAGWDVFIVASYGKIIPSSILEIPKHGTLNVHPSLLPKLRGPSPIKTAILTENETGVTIMRLDEEMDHGPLVAQEKADIPDWPPRADILESILGKMGGMLLADILPKWIDGSITEQPQDHSLATFSKKIEKADALIDLSADPYANFKKIQAYIDSPKPYFFIEKNGRQLRVVITKAAYENGLLKILAVIPEGKGEMAYADFAKGYLKGDN